MYNKLKRKNAWDIGAWIATDRNRKEPDRWEMIFQNSFYLPFFDYE